MKTIAILFFICVSVPSIGQPSERPPRKIYDFSGVDPKTIDEKKLHRQYDSLYHGVRLDSIQQLIQYHYNNAFARDYNAFSIGLLEQTASLKSLNKGLRDAGMETISDRFLVMPIGMTIKTNRFVINYIGHFLFRNKSEDDTRKLEARGFSFEMGVGYDLINSKRFQLYPQASLAYQTFNLKAVSQNASTSINQVDQLFSQPGNTSLSKKSLMLNYGVEADYFVTQEKNGGGVILGLVYGMSTDLAGGKFKMEGDRSSINIHNDRLKTSYVGLIVKFALKSY
jgi:hypothetical protein